jgi:hypothetical protein
VTSGSGQITAPMTILRFAGTWQKLRHTCLAPGLCQGLPIAFGTGQVTGRLLRQVTFTILYCRAVMGHSAHDFDREILKQTAKIELK